METVAINVKTLDGHSLAVTVPLSGTVKDIRKQLLSHHGLPKCALYLQVGVVCQEQGGPWAHTGT